MDDTRKALQEELSALKTRKRDLDDEIRYLVGKIGDFADHPQGDAGAEIDQEFDKAKEELGVVQKRIDEIEKSQLN